MIIKYNQKQELARAYSISLEEITYHACYLGFGQIITLFPIMFNILDIIHKLQKKIK